MMKDTSREQLCKELKNLRTAVVTAHVAPDPDAIGSSCALAQGLLQLGVEAVVYFDDLVPVRIQPLLGGLSVASSVPKDVADALIVVDTASRKRTSGDIDALASQAKQIINIDHHVSNDRWGDLNYLVPSAPSSANIVFDILKTLGVSVSPESATLLLAGLMDDTGCFRFSNTSEEAFLDAAALVACGASPEEIANNLYFSLPMKVFQLRKFLLEDLELVGNGLVSFAGLTQEQLKAAGAEAEDTEGLVDELRSIDGTCAAVFYREMEDGWKFSLRSKIPELSMDEIAKEFGGGGHRAAAGCKLEGSRGEIRRRMQTRIEQAVAAARPQNR